jgi:predicted HicB family RNase H-like nuclease
MDEKKGAYRFVLRLPRSLAEDLTEAAREENVSLNQYMLYILSRYGIKKSKGD